MARIPRRPLQSAFAQGDLFGGRSLQTQVIAKREDFESLFNGFVQMHAIAYVVSSNLLHEFFQKREYKDIEVLVGEDMTEPALRQELQDKPADIIEALAGYVESGSLRILIPRRSIHTKLYILENPETTRIIQTSANLTETARKASQMNYAWYIDLPKEHEFVLKVLEDYRSHTKGSTIFMNDLLDLFKEHNNTSKRELIEVWVKGETLPSPELETAKIFQELSAQSLLVPGDSEARIVTVKLPEAPDARKEIERLLKPLKPSITSNSINVRSSAVVNYVHDVYGIPLMRIDAVKRELRLGLKGTILSLSEPLPSAKDVDEGLAHIEDYIGTVELGKSPEPRYVKASMFEALLYVFFSPFATEYMRKKRVAYGQVDSKGPRFLYIYGPTQNGKTTFLRFALKLLTGQDIEALPRDEFARRKIMGAATVGTVFPLVFDDVGFSGKTWAQDVVKAYWETWWRSDLDVPQLVLSSNEPKLQDWARSRVKRIDFDIQFASNEKGKRRLKELFEHENRVFRWFAYLYIQHSTEDKEFSDDELYMARAVMHRLYTYAGRTVPTFFLDEPIERKYDLGKARWADLVYKRREAKVVREKDRLLVRFPSQMQFYEIRRFEGYLPPEIKARQEGYTIIIETPQEFDSWCPPSPKRLWPFSAK